MGLIGGVLSAGFGSSGNGQDLTSPFTQYQNEEGGVDLVGFSGGAQDISNVLKDNPSLANSVTSTTYLSPGLNLFSGHLFEATDNESFKGSGFADFAATIRARLTKVQLTPTGAKGHNFEAEFASAPVQNRLASFSGTRGPCKGGPQTSGSSGGGGEGIGGGFFSFEEFFSGESDGEGGFGPGGWGQVTVWRGPIFHVL